MIKFDLSQGFPENWVVSSTEKEYAFSIYNSFFREKENGMIVNLTWGGIGVRNSSKSKYDEVRDILDQNLASCVLFFNFVDDYDSEWIPVIELAREKLGNNNCKIVGVTPFKNDYNFDFWPLATAKHFQTYNEKDILPKEFKYKYICYNRKPHGHRVELYQKFKKEKLFNSGIFTLGGEESKAIKTFEANDYSGNEDAFKLFTKEPPHGIPHDVMSLGDLQSWNSSFLNIVTETNTDQSKFFLITEKTFKPIIGLRPFLILGPKYITSWLNSNGFETFNSDFNCPDDPSTVDLANVVKNLDLNNLNDMYKDLYPKIKRNKERLFEYYREKENFLNSLTKPK